MSLAVWVATTLRAGEDWNIMQSRRWNDMEQFGFRMGSLPRSGPSIAVPPALLVHVGASCGAQEGVRSFRIFPCPSVVGSRYF
eukprot:1916834-Pyramimonas_sp.AAC.1